MVKLRENECHTDPSTRICSGYKLVTDGQDARAIQHTVRYTATNPARFENLWR
jgi:hypothetical protein